MSWPELIEIIEQEAGKELSARILTRLRYELGGVRVTIGKRQNVTIDDINNAAPGNVKKAAQKLNVHPRTIYRVLQRSRVIR